MPPLNALESPGCLHLVGISAAARMTTFLLLQERTEDGDAYLDVQISLDGDRQRLVTPSRKRLLVERSTRLAAPVRRDAFSAKERER